MVAKWVSDAEKTGSTDKPVTARQVPAASAARTWTLIQTAPGALVYTAPALEPSTHPPTPHPVGGWVPDASPDEQTDPHQPEHHSALEYAGYIGRVGLLAAALGLGAAVAHTPGIAWAEPTETESSTSSSESASARSKPTETQSTPPRSGPSRERAASTRPTSGKSSVTTKLGQPSTAAGPQTSRTRPSALDDSAAIRENTAVQQTETPTAQPSTAESEAPAVLDGTARRHAREGVASGTSERAAIHDTTPGSQHDSAEVHPAGPSAPHTGIGIGIASPATDPSDRAGLTVPASTPAPVPVAESNPTQIVTPFTAPTPVPARADIVTSLLGTLGFSPLNSPNSAALVQAPASWAALDWTRRHKNQPTADQIASGTTPNGLTEGGPTPHRGTGIPAGEVLTYRVAGGPADGTVTIAPDGSYTYTPTTGQNAGSNTPALQDTFTVTVHSPTGTSTTVPVTATTYSTTSPATTTLILADPHGTTNTVHLSITPTAADTGQAARLAIHNPTYDTTATTATLPSGTIPGVITATIPVGTNPSAIAINGSTLYVANRGGNTVTVINTSTNTTVGSPITVGTNPTSLTASGNRLYVTNSGSNTVSVIDTKTNTVVGSPITVGANPSAINANGNTMYVANSGSNTVTVINTKTNTVTGSPITVGTAPAGLAMFGNSLYVANSGSNTVTVINTKTNKVVGSPISVGTNPIAITTYGNLLYVTNKGSNTVTMIDTKTNTVLGGPITVGTNPTAITTNGTRLYIANSGSNSVTVIDTGTKTVLGGPITVGTNPIAVTASGTRLYVANSGSNTVSAINTSVTNNAPTFGDPAYTITAVNPGTGVVAGTLNVTDPNGDPLSFTSPVTSGKGGTAIISAQGLFTYTPTTTARHDAATNGAGTDLTQDSFTVTVTDGRGGATPVPVSGVPISPTNTAPTGTPTVGAPDPATGIVTGSITATDPENDPLTYTGTTSTTKGAIIVNTDGTFTYTPTTDARHNAATTGAGTDLTQDTFTVTINDAHLGGTTPVPVTVDISPTNTAPTGTPTFSDYGPTGVVTGSLNVTDPDADPVTYTLTGDPADGAVTVNTDGSFSYTPHDNARLLANTTPGADTDSFTVTVTDGHGGTTAIPVTTVPVGPAQTTVTDTIPLGTDPYGIAFSPNGTRAYIATPKTNAVQVIDTATKTVIDTIAVGTGPYFLTVSPDGTRAYVANAGGNSVSVIDTDPDSATNNTVIGTIGVGTGPQGVAVTPDGTRVYVNNFNWQGPGSVSVIDTATNTVTATIPVGASPWGIAISPDGTRAYAVNTFGSSVSVIDTEPTSATFNTVVATVGVAYYSHGVAISPDGTRVYVANSNDNTVTVINTATNTVTATAGAGNFPSQVAFSPDGTLVYVSNLNDGDSVTVLNSDPASATYNTILATVGVGRLPWGVAVSPDGSAYASNVGGNSLSVISLVPAAPLANTTIGAPDPATGQVTVTLNASDPEGDALTATNTTPAKGQVSVIDNGGGTWTYTYTPTTTARHTAAADTATPADKQDTFTVAVTDTHNGTATVGVSVVVSPANAVPSGTASFGSPDPATGLVTGTIGAADADNDTLTYTLTGNPAKGIVTVNPDGTFTYDPTDAGRLRAGLSAGSDVDSFTVTVNDGHGAVVPVTVENVAVSPAHTTNAGFIPLGYKVWPVVFNPVTNHAYFGYYSDYPWNGLPNRVTVVNTTTNAVVGNISMPRGPATSLAISPDGTRVYAPNLWSGYLTVIDTGSNSIVDTVPIGTAPQGVAMSSDGQRVYISCGGSNAVYAVDTATNTVVATIPATGGIIGIAVSPDGSRVYTANSQSKSVSVIDTATNAVITTVPVGIGPPMLAVTPDGSRIYVANRGSNTVSVIDTAANTVVATVPVGAEPHAVAISPDGSLAYVTNAASRTLSLIDTGDNTVISTVPLGGSDNNLGVAVSPDGSKIYATNAYSENATIINTVPG